MSSITAVWRKTSLECSGVTLVLLMQDLGNFNKVNCLFALTDWLTMHWLHLQHDH